MTTELSGHLES